MIDAALDGDRPRAFPDPHRAERLWTVGIVNYRSAIYIRWQLKILFEANPPESFQLVLVDNSRPHERAELEKLVAPYRAKFGNVELIFHTPAEGPASIQHGEALEIVRARTRTPYLLVHDPDFFWVRNGYLRTLAGILEAGALVVGAPYPEKVGIGDPWFPAAFGCAYRMAALAGLDFVASVTPETIAESFARWPRTDGYGFSFDVGWRIREALSEKPHVSFEQRAAPELNRSIGPHSFEIISREYLHEGRRIAFHLFRGSFTGLWTKAFADPATEVPKQWQEVRGRLGAHFYDCFRRDRGEPSLKRWLRTQVRRIRSMAR